MAFFPPRFNVWCAVWRLYNTSTFPGTLVGYSICQLRGPDSKLDGLTLTSYGEVLFPKRSDVRQPTKFVLPPDGYITDLIQMAGWQKPLMKVESVCDKGAGFPNEYRQAACSIIPYGEYGTVSGTSKIDPVNVELMPPDGYTPLVILTPSDHW